MVDPEPRGLVAPDQEPEGEQQGVIQTLLGWADTWEFPTVDSWKDRFGTLEEALPFLATLTAGERYIWWATGDIAEALMQKFGRTEGVKARIGAIFGRKVRTVENRARAATLFKPEKRHPDVPIAMYMESIMWEDPIATLEAALESGTGWLALRLERMGGEGHMIGPRVWTSYQGMMRWHKMEGNQTAYTITIIEEGGSRFAAAEMPVIVTVALATE